jgi:hypothetical protein
LGLSLSISPFQFEVRNHKAIPSTSAAFGTGLNKKLQLPTTFRLPKTTHTQNIQILNIILTMTTMALFTMGSSYLCLISVALLATAFGPTTAFLAPSPKTTTASATTYSVFEGVLLSSSSSTSASPFNRCYTTTTSSLSMSSTANKPDLVDQKAFVAAIQRIENEIFALEQQQQQEQQQQYEGGGDGDGQQQQQSPPQPQQQAPAIDQDVVLAIGRLYVELPIDTQPELDLTESEGPLVLVTGVWGRTAEETGLQVYDTIVSVSVGGDNMNEQEQQTPPTFSAYTKGQTLDQTAAVLTAAAQHSLQAGGTRITLEVNRLIQGFYASEQEEQAAIQDAYDSQLQQQQQQQQQYDQYENNDGLMGQQ